MNDMRIRLLKNVEHVDIPVYSASQPIQINNNEFVIVTDSDEIWKYNVISNKWIQWIKDIPPILEFLAPICFDSINNVLFIYSSNVWFGSNLLKVDVNTKKFELYDSFSNTVHLAQLLFIDGTLHLFGRESCFNPNSQHWIFDDEVEDFKKFHDFGISAHGDIIHLKSRNILIKTGLPNAVQKYDIADNRWSEFETNSTTFPSIYGGFCCLTMNEKYLIYATTQDVEILDMTDNNNYKIITTKIGCPGEKSYHGMIMNEKSKQELIVFGYVRYCWNKYKICLQRFPPRYLIHLMQSWLSDEFLYISQNNKFGSNVKSLLKIRVDDILSASL